MSAPPPPPPSQPAPPPSQPAPPSPAPPGPRAVGGPRLRDRTAEAVAARRREIERGLAELVTPELVEEHRRQPVGRHSPALAWVLAYFRQAPTDGKLVVHARRPDDASAGPGPLPFSLLRLSGRPGVPHEPAAGEGFATEHDALHAAFLDRVAELGGDGRGRGGSTAAAHDG